MRGLKTLVAGTGLAAFAAIMSAQSANALATYSATADLQVSAYSASKPKGWTPAVFTTTESSSYAIGSQPSAGTESVITNFGATTHSYVPVASAFATKVYANTASRKVINASKTLSGSADAVGGASAAISTAAQTVHLAVYFFNKDANAIDGQFSASISLNLLTSIDDALTESAFATGTGYATITPYLGATTSLGSFDLTSSSMDGVGTGASTGAKTFSFTLPSGPPTSYVVADFYMTLAGYATSSVPLPAALPMLGLALGGLGFAARRRSKKLDA